MKHNKNIFIVFFTWMLLAAAGFSQTVTPQDTTVIVPPVQPPPKLSFSIRAGLNIAQIFGQGSQAFNHFGFSGGPKLTYRFADRWSFAPEILYNMKGSARFPNPEKGDYYSFSLDLDYLEFPLLFNYYFGKKKNLSVEFGPSIGVLVRAKAYENNLAINTTNAKAPFNAYDISLMAGINYFLPKGFTLGFRYTNSIVPIVPTNAPSNTWGLATFNIGQLNSVLNFSLMYTFNFKKKEQVMLEDGTIVPKEKKKKEKVKKQKGDVTDED